MEAKELFDAFYKKLEELKKHYYSRSIESIHSTSHADFEYYLGEANAIESAMTEFYLLYKKSTKEIKQ